MDWFFSFLRTVVLCFFECLISFDWMLDIMNFLLFAVGFSIPFNSERLCSGMLSNYSETILML